MEFNCVKKNMRTGRIVRRWTGRVLCCKPLGNDCYEIHISSLSTIFLTLANTSRGWVAAIPDWNAGCSLSQDLCDVFYNTERLTDSMRNKVDAITVAFALAAVGRSIREKEGPAGS